MQLTIKSKINHHLHHHLRHNLRHNLGYGLYTLLLLLALGLNSVAQALEPTVRFERLSIEHGLSQNTVTSILQDSRGFIWFGTRDGLNRYDGYEFKVFRHNSKQPDSISDNFIWSLFEDSSGVLWVGTGTGGLNRYNPLSESFSHFRHQPNVANSLSHNGIRAIFEDSRGTLWVGTNAGGLNRFDHNNQTFTHLRHQPNDPHSLSHDNVYSITEDNLGILWVGTENGLNRYNKTQQTFARFQHHQEIKNSLSNNRVRSVYQDSKGTLWVATDGGGLNQYNPTTQSFKHFKHDATNPQSISSDHVIDITQDSDGKLWLATWGGGISQYDINSNRFVHLRHNNANPNSISSDLIYSLFKDNKGLLWIGSSGGGVSLHNPQTTEFQHYQHNKSIPSSLSGNNVRSILKDKKGTLWVGTRSNGLNRYDHQQQGFAHYRHAHNNPNSLSDGPIYTLFEDSKGQIWIGTAKGLNRYDAVNDHFIRYQYKQHDTNSLTDNRIKAIAEDASGRLWIGTTNGLNRFDHHTGAFIRYKHQPKLKSSLSHNKVMSVYQDNNNVLWVGTLGGGLNRYDPATDGFVQYQHQQSNPNSLSHNWVFAIHQDQKGNLWVGTSGGLNRFDADKKQFIRYTEEDGLANNTVFGILEDKQGLLWISSNKGLSTFDPNTASFKIYQAKDGLQSNEFSLGATHQSHDGEMFFGGIKGFNRFYAANLKQNHSVPNVVLNRFLLSNQDVPIRLQSTEFEQADKQDHFFLSKAINELDEIALTYKQRLVSFQFSALDFTDPMATRYAYRLKGWDDDWIYTDATRRFATYTKLDPGHYLFEVKASSRDGVWQQQSKNITITVLAPWWKTWQAYLLYTLTLLAAFYALYRYRTQALQQRANKLEQKVVQRTATINQLMSQKQRMFANVSHEFKTPLTLILNPLESISLKQDQSEFERKVSMMKRNGQRLLRMVDQLLELSKLDTTQAEQHHNYSLAETLNRLLTSFQPLFDSKNLTLNHQPFDDLLLFLTADSLEMIFNNLISNAIKYTPANGEITISVSHDGSEVTIAVQDSGIGISEENQQIVFNRFTRASENHGENIPGAGIGLALVKELVETNNGHIRLSSQVNGGSTFTVTLPLSKEQDIAVTQISGLSTASLIEIDNPNDSLSRQTKPADGVESTKPTLLLIDDNPDMLELLTDTLTAKYHLLTAHNGELGLLTAKEQLPDLVLSDVMMPGISGFEVLKQLKLDELTNHIPVVLLTAKGDVQSRIKGWAEKADEYLEKPFNGEELIIRLDNLLSVRALLRHRYQRAFTDEPQKALVVETKSDVKSVKSDRAPKQNQTLEKDNAKESTKESVKEKAKEKAREKAQEKTLNSVNQVFFDNIHAVLEKHYHDEKLDVSFLASELAMSQRQLTRKTRSLLDFTPAESIRSFRLKKAVELLNQGTLPSVVAHEVGFTSHSYFSQCFKAQYGCNPSSYKGA